MIAIPLLSILFVFIILLGHVLKTTALNKQVQNKDKEILDLNEKLTLLEEFITDYNEGAEKPEPASKQKGDKDSSINIEFPFINYVPEGIFTDEEKEQLQEKLVEPFFDFFHEDEELYIALIVEKLASADDEGDFRFDITTLDKYGNYGGFLYGEGKKLEWWLPDCLDSCEFSEIFEEKYPEIIEEYKNLTN